MPDFLKWDLWLGPAAERPYHSDWLHWHTWRDFATGQLGNWAVHTMNLAFKALKLDSLWSGERDALETIRIEGKVSGIQTETFPNWEIVRYDFPAREELPPVEVNWYNGGSAPGVREKIENLLGRKLDWGDAGAREWRDHAGILLIGSKGKIHANGHNTVFTLLPEKKFEDFEGPEPTLPRSPGHQKEWVEACQGGPAAMSNFNYGGPLTEFVLLGNVATRFEGTLEFDPKAASILNNAEADKALMRNYREGWKL